jgi:hypothetical protein
MQAGLLVGCGTVHKADGIDDPFESASAGDQDSAASELDEPELRWLYLLERVAGEDGVLWVYDRDLGTIEELGPLDCGLSGSGSYLAALSADPKGTLWALGKNSQLYIVTIASLGCSQSSIQAESEVFLPESLAFLDIQGSNFFYLSGFLVSANGSSSSGLAHVSGSEVEVIGEVSNFEGQGAVMDISSLANGDLYGYRSWGGLSELAEYDNQTAAMKRTWTVPLGTGQAFGFAMLGEEALLFTATGPDGVSEMHSYHTASEELAYESALPFTVVGVAAVAE